MVTVSNLIKKSVVFAGLLGLCAPVQGMQWMRNAYNAVRSCGQRMASATAKVVKRYPKTSQAVATGALVVAAIAPPMSLTYVVSRVVGKPVSPEVEKFVQDRCDRLGIRNRFVLRERIEYAAGPWDLLYVPPKTEFTDWDNFALVHELGHHHYGHQRLGVGELTAWSWTVGAGGLAGAGLANKLNRFVPSLRFIRLICKGALGLGGCIGADYLAHKSTPLIMRPVYKRNERNADQFAIEHSSTAELRAAERMFLKNHEDCMPLLDLKPGEITMFEHDIDFRERSWNRIDNKHPSSLTRAQYIRAEINRRRTEIGRRGREAMKQALADRAAFKNIVFGGGDNA